MAKPLIIVPIKAREIQSAIADIALAKKKGATAIELRLDFIKPQNAEELRQLIHSTKLPCIATCRPKREGGAFAGTEASRVELLKGAISAGAKTIDIELSTSPRLREGLLKFACAHGAKAIVSFHDFQKTPPLETLVAVLAREVNARANICKIIPFSKSEKDNWAVMQLAQVAKARKIPFLIFAMGEKGKPTRISSILLGAWGGFATLGKGKETASGQLSISELKKL